MIEHSRLTGDPSGLAEMREQRRIEALGDRLLPRRERPGAPWLSVSGPHDQIIAIIEEGILHRRRG